MKHSGKKNLSLDSMWMVTETGNIFRVTTIKNKTKIISSIRDRDEIISDRQKISEHFVNYEQCYIYQ